MLFKRALTSVIATAFAIPTLTGSALAGIDEIRAGVSLQSSGPVAPNVERGAAVAGEIVFDAPRFLDWGVLKGRPHIGGSFALNDEATSFGHVGVTWRFSAPVAKPFIDFGVGAAIHDGRTDFNPAIEDPRLADEAFLGCRALVRLHVAPGVKLAPGVTASIQWEHLSNANLCSENEGLDNLGFRLGVRF